MNQAEFNYSSSLFICSFSALSLTHTLFNLPFSKQEQLNRLPPSESPGASGPAAQQWTPAPGALAGRSANASRLRRGFRAVARLPVRWVLLDRGPCRPARPAAAYTAPFPSSASPARRDAHVRRATRNRSTAGRGEQQQWVRDLGEGCEQQPQRQHFLTAFISAPHLLVTRKPTIYYYCYYFETTITTDKHKRTPFNGSSDFCVAKRKHQ